MKREERSKALDSLKYDPGCEVLLVSLKAGGVGLNLTAAQRVILMDPCWWVYLSRFGTLPMILIVPRLDVGTLPLNTKPWIGS